VMHKELRNLASMLHFGDAQGTQKFGFHAFHFGDAQGTQKRVSYSLRNIAHLDFF
jgi:hypothetical protein